MKTPLNFIQLCAMYNRGVGEYRIDTREQRLKMASIIRDYHDSGWVVHCYRDVFTKKMLVATRTKDLTDWFYP